MCCSLKCGTIFEGREPDITRLATALNVSKWGCAGVGVAAEHLVWSA